MAKKHLYNGFAGLEIFVAVVVFGVIAFFAASLLQKPSPENSAVLSSTIVNWNSSQVFNQDGTSYSSSGAWIGTGQNAGSSYLGMIFSGDSLPQGSQISNAKVEFSSPEDYWIQVSTDFYADTSTNPANFSSSNPPAGRSLTSSNHGYSDNSKWEAGKTYSYDITNVVQELVNSADRNKIAIVVKGAGGSWGRKFINNNPKLVVTFDPAGGTVQTAQPTATPTIAPTATPIAVPTVVPTLAPTPTPRPTATPTVAPTSTPSPIPTLSITPAPTPIVTVPQGSGGTGQIFGMVTADVLGTCLAAVHDKYVTTGPDGQTYRTWHPAQDPSGCTFGHEHGDNPESSTIFSGKKVPFGYIARHLNMDEPHVGFKCFVHNKGTRNDEGRTMQHDSYYCFHMGTGGPARFTARFHSLDFHFKSAVGYIMNIQAMADVGNVGTICANPRQQRTVQGFGCLLDSAYEIWANDVRINNRGNTVAFVEASTAVFDPITSMDPADKTRLVYTWSDEAQQKIFKFNDPREHYRGCEREAYSGPLAWYNRGGSEVYYTDAYGNVVDGGPLRQEISTINTSANSGYIDQFGGLRMTEAANPQTQFKFAKSACVPGLGVKN